MSFKEIEIQVSERSKIAKLMKIYAYKYLGERLFPVLNGDEEDEEECAEMYENDFNDFIEISKYIENGKITEAYEYWRSMDTAPREGIPDKVYEYMESEKGSEKDPE